MDGAPAVQAALRRRTTRINPRARSAAGSGGAAVASLSARRNAARFYAHADHQYASSRTCCGSEEVWCEAQEPGGGMR